MFLMVFPPREVIEIDNEDNDLFFPPANTLSLTKAELAPQPKVNTTPCRHYSPLNGRLVQGGHPTISRTIYS